MFRTSLNYRRIATRLRCQRGVALVEFALVLPLLLLLLLGMLDFGRAFNYWIDGTHLANEGSRFAVVNKNPGSGTLQQYILNSGDTSQFKTSGKVCISFPNGTSNVGDPVQMSVTVPYNFLGFIGSKIGVGSVSITSTSTMRLEALPSNYSAGCTS